MELKELEQNESFLELCEQVRMELSRLQRDRHDCQPALEAERKQLDEQIRGWMLSLANPMLDFSVRQAIEGESQRAMARKQEIEIALQQDNAEAKALTTAIDAKKVVDRINRLHEVLAMNNPSMGNIELSLHIDRIDCFADGRAELRICRLGAFSDVIPSLANEDSPSQGTRKSVSPDVKRITPRLLSPRQVDDLDSTDSDLAALSHFAADPHRFSGLDKKWFETRVFRVPLVLGWAERNADEVLKRKEETGMLQYELAEEFKVSLPTIRKALKIAENRRNGSSKT